MKNIILSVASLAFAFALTSAEAASNIVVECHFESMNLLTNQPLNGFTHIRIEPTYNKPAGLEGEWAYEVSVFDSEKRISHEFFLKQEENESNGEYKLPVLAGIARTIKKETSTRGITAWSLNIPEEKSSSANCFENRDE